MEHIPQNPEQPTWKTKLRRGVLLLVAGLGLAGTLKAQAPKSTPLPTLPPVPSLRQDIPPDTVATDPNGYDREPMEKLQPFDNIISPAERLLQQKLDEYRKETGQEPDEATIIFYRKAVQEELRKGSPSTEGPAT